MNPYNQGFGPSGYNSAQQANTMSFNQPYGQQFANSQYIPPQGLPGMTPPGQTSMYSQQGQNMGYPHWMQQTNYQAPQNQLQQWFQTADFNKDGSINVTELENAMALSGQHFSGSTIRAMMQMFDLDRNGVLNFQEFLALYNYIIQMKQAYEQCNRDGSGLTITDAQSAVGTHRSLGSMSGIAQMIPSLFPFFDKTGSGKLDLNGFIKMACYLGKIMTNYEHMGGTGAMGGMGGMAGMMGAMSGMQTGHGMMSGMSNMGGMNQMPGYAPSGMGMGMNQMGMYPNNPYPMGGQPDIMAIGSQVVNQLMGNKGKKDKKMKKDKKYYT